MTDKTEQVAEVPAEPAPMAAEPAPVAPPADGKTQTAMVAPEEEPRRRLPPARRR